MIIVTISSEDTKYAEMIEEMAEMSIMLKEPKSFSSEELQLIQIGATIASPFLVKLVDLFIEMWKARRGYSIKIGKDEFSCSGFTKEETLELAEKYAPAYIKTDAGEEEMIREAVKAFLQKENECEEKNDGKED